MAIPEKPSLLDLPSLEAGESGASRDDRKTDSATTSTPVEETARCPVVRDLLGDFSEQTGSFFE